MNTSKCLLLGLMLIGLCKSGLNKKIPPVSNDETGLRSEDSDYNYEDEYEDKSDVDGPKNIIADSNSISDIPHFNNTEMTKIYKVGDTAVLDCNVPASFLVLWYMQKQREKTLLFQSQFKLHKDERMSVHKNHSLCIRNVQQHDDSQYYCTILPNNISLITNLHVESSPSAKIFAADGRDISDRSITFRQGERIEIKCEGFGRPMPTIKWAANGERIFDGGLHGVHIKDDGSLVIDHADHHHNLLYQCLAEYGSSVGHATININVQYSPKVSSHRRHVNTIEDGSAELHCNYKSSLPVTISWSHDNKPVNLNDPLKYDVLSEYRNTTHNSSILVISNIVASDLGEYKCDIQNSIGKAHITIHLNFLPEAPVFERIEHSDAMVITNWKIRCLQSLTEVMLNYKKNGTKTWKSEKPTHIEKSTKDSAFWEVEDKLELSPGMWHVRVRAKNSIGWSAYSLEEIIVIQPRAEATNEISTTGAASMTLLSSIAIWTVLARIIIEYI